MGHQMKPETLKLIEKLIYTIEYQVEKNNLKEPTDLLNMLKILQIQAKVR